MNIVKKLFGSFRTNGLYMMFAAQMLNKAGINIEVEQLGTDLDMIATGFGAAMSAFGVIRDYVRKFRGKK